MPRRGVISGVVMKTGRLTVGEVTGSADAPVAVAVDFDTLFEAERKPMVRLAFLMIGSEALAEEIVQDAFARVLERWQRIDNPGGYLRRCVVNGCRDQHRRQALERRLRPQPPPDATLGADELVDALSGLSTQRRAVVVLRYYDGLTQEEIAAVLGMRIGTVKSALHRALGELREVIER